MASNNVTRLERLVNDENLSNHLQNIARKSGYAELSKEFAALLDDLTTRHGVNYEAPSSRDDAPSPVHSYQIAKRSQGYQLSQTPQVEECEHGKDASAPVSSVPVFSPAPPLPDVVVPNFVTTRKRPGNKRRKDMEIEVSALSPMMPRTLSPLLGPCDDGGLESSSSSSRHEGPSECAERANEKYDKASHFHISDSLETPDFPYPSEETRAVDEAARAGIESVDHVLFPESETGVQLSRHAKVGADAGAPVWEFFTALAEPSHGNHRVVAGRESPRAEQEESKRPASPDPQTHSQRDGFSTRDAVSSGRGSVDTTLAPSVLAGCSTDPLSANPSPPTAGGGGGAGARRGVAWISPDLDAFLDADRQAISTPHLSHEVCAAKGKKPKHRDPDQKQRVEGEEIDSVTCVDISSLFEEPNPYATEALAVRARSTMSTDSRRSHRFSVQSVGSSVVADLISTRPSLPPSIHALGARLSQVRRASTLAADAQTMMSRNVDVDNDVNNVDAARKVSLGGKSERTDQVESFVMTSEDGDDSVSDEISVGESEEFDEAEEAELDDVRAVDEREEAKRGDGGEHLEVVGGEMSDEHFDDATEYRLSVLPKPSEESSPMNTATDVPVCLNATDNSNRKFTSFSDGGSLVAAEDSTQHSVATAVCGEKPQPNRETVNKDVDNDKQSDDDHYGDNDDDDDVQIVRPKRPALRATSSSVSNVNTTTTTFTSSTTTTLASSAVFESSRLDNSSVPVIELKDDVSNAESESELESESEAEVYRDGRTPARRGAPTKDTRGRWRRPTARKPPTTSSSSTNGSGESDDSSDDSTSSSDSDTADDSSDASDDSSNSPGNRPAPPRSRETPGPRKGGRPTTSRGGGSGSGSGSGSRDREESESDRGDGATDAQTKLTKREPVASKGRDASSRKANEKHSFAQLKVRHLYA